jgi:hypothetical protein
LAARKRLANLLPVLSQECVPNTEESYPWNMSTNWQHIVLLPAARNGAVLTPLRTKQSNLLSFVAFVIVSVDARLEQSALNSDIYTFRIYAGC